MVAFHRSRGAAATIALTCVADPSAFGVVEASDDGQVSRFVEKPPPGQATSHWINAGVYVLEPDVLRLVPPGEPYMFERGLFPGLLERSDPVYGFRHPGYWLDMGTPGKYLRLSEDLLRGTAASPLVTPLTEGEVRVESAADVHPTARVSGPALLGDGCRVGAGARIEGPAVLGPGCSVGEGAIIDRVVLWDGASVGPGVCVSRSVLGGGVTVGAGVRLADSALVGHLGRVAVDG
jgi:NDP-sugar pyrophosphorylase family protein